LELATDYLIAHIGEFEEASKEENDEDEIALALAMSLGTPLKEANKEASKAEGKGKEVQADEELDQAAIVGLLKSFIVPKCLDILELVDGSIANLSSFAAVFFSAMHSEEKDTSSDSVTSISSIVSSIVDRVLLAHSQNLSVEPINRLLHFLAVILHSGEEAVRLYLKQSEQERVKIAGYILQWLRDFINQQQPLSNDDTKITAPDWICSALLVLEELSKVAGYEEGTHSSIYFLPFEQREQALEACQSLLKLCDKQLVISRNTVHAILLLLAKLTRDYNLSARFMKSDLIEDILVLISKEVSFFLVQT